jgi:hypothetical protein
VRTLNEKVHISTEFAIMCRANNNGTAGKIGVAIYVLKRE